MFSYTQAEYEEKFKNPEFPVKQIAPFNRYYDYKYTEISKEEYYENEAKIDKMCIDIIIQNEKVIHLALSNGLILSTEDLFKDSKFKRVFEKYSHLYDRKIIREIKKIESYRGSYIMDCNIPYELKNFTNHLLDYTPTEAKTVLLKCIQDFRMMNQDKYEFTFQCPICYETSHDEKFLIKLCKCGHKCCLDCWKDHCINIISNTQDKLHCFDCEEEISQVLINEYKLVPFDKLNKYYLVQYNKNYGNLIYCNQCKGVYINANNKQDCRCPHCQYLMCTMCCEAGHHQKDCNMNCQEFEMFMKKPEYVEFVLRRENIRLDLAWKASAEFRRREEEERLRKEALERKRREEEERQRLIRQQEEQTQKWIQSNTKACPKCHARIEKNKGCNHMTCRNCKYEFCWYCFKEVVGNDGAHYHFNIEGCAAGKKWFDDNYRED